MDMRNRPEEPGIKPTLDEIFCPRGIAVVGASPLNLSFAELVVHSLKEAKFPAVFPVNPKYKEVLGLPCYPSLTDIPGAVDHVIVSIPAESVLKLLDDCAAKRVKSVHFFTAGFGETGDAEMEAEIKGQWVKDPFPDDRGVGLKVKGKGLVVIGGCSHAGIINTVKHAQKVTGASKVHAVLGGFHLTGPMMEPIIDSTIGEIKKFGADYVVPTHCTGWRAINQFAKEMAEQFVLNTVGTTYIFA